jgi:hypothetical protein
MQITKSGTSKSTLLKKLEKSNKVLVKYGFQPGTIISEKAIYVTTNGTEVEKPEFPTPEIKYRETEFTIEIPTLKVGIDGTQFIASLEFGSEEAGNRIVCGFDPENPKAEIYNQMLLDLARSKKNNCDHCNTLRTRNKLFIFLKEEKIFTIGSTCAHEWFGFNIEGFLSAWKQVANLNEDEEGYGNKRYRMMEYVSEILTYSMASIKNQGFVGPKFDNSTANDASTCYQYVHPNAYLGRPKCPESYTYYTKNYDTINAMIVEMTEWYQAFEPKSLFEHNLRSGVLDLSLTTAMAPWACRMWMDAKAIGYEIVDGSVKAKEEKPEILTSPDQYISEVGAKKVSVKGQISFVRAFDGEFGTTYLIKIASELGDLVWFTGKFDYDNCDYNNLTPGTWVEICGTIKKQDKYNDKCQTTFTRCNLKTVEV